MDTEDITLENISSWKVETLRNFLSKRGLSTDGNKQELIALCFAAAKMKIATLPSNDDYLKQNARDYDNLLCIDGQKVPDPLKLASNWLDEKEGMSVWPPVFLSDIANFFMGIGDNANTRSYLNDYKLGKAYEYFSAKWIKTLFYHSISRDSPFCFLRAKCTPSQRVNDEDHTVWVCTEKDTGTVKSAYCSCTAGLGQTCSHVAGMLFRLESANKLGLSACTSLPCTWNVPKASKVEPRLVSEIKIKKSRHGKDVKRPLVSIEKSNYDPLESVSADGKALLTNLAHILPESVLCKGIKIPDVTVSESESKVTDVPDRLVQELQMDTRESSPNVDSFFRELPTLSDNDINMLNAATIGQHENKTWHSLRAGRVTASKFYSIYTRVNSYSKNPNADMTTLIASVMGYVKPNCNIKSLKFGRESEPAAKKIYKQEYEKNHTNASFSECGIFLDKNRTYLAATPDMLVTCDCCGNGLLEVKSVMIPKCETCSAFCTCELPVFLYNCNNSLAVKKNHSYFCQIQGQMALTQRRWCDLYVYSVNGCFKERVYFDAKYFENVLPNLEFFFKSFIVPEIISRSIQTSLSAPQPCSEPMDVDPECGSTFFCIICHCQIQEQENIHSFQYRSICCDICDRWYHFKCVNITKSSLEKMKDWVCPMCKDQY